MPADITLAQLNSTFGSYPVAIDANPQETLGTRIERETLYVLSHLVL